jgi:hypothetical protein
LILGMGFGAPRSFRVMKWKRGWCLRVVLVIGGVVGNGCAFYSSGSVDTEESGVNVAAPHTDAGAQVAVIGYLMRDLADAGQRVPCVGKWDGGDVDFAEAEMLLLRGLKAAVVPASECRLESPMGSMIHVPTGRPAIVFRAHAPRPDRGDRYRVIGGYFRASLNAASCTYIAARIDGGWNVRRDNDAPCAVA